MSRKVVDTPLFGAAPTLQPQRQQLALQPAAPQPARRSNLMELGQALEGWFPVLREKLRDEAARQEKDAMALGEIEASRDLAEKNLVEIETALKEHVDNGVLPSFQHPAAQRAYYARIGDGIARTEFQQALTAAKDKAVSLDHGGPSAIEEAINTAYAGVAEKLKGSHLFAQAGFDNTAQQIANAWRNQSLEEYTARFDADMQTKRADEGVELLHQFTATPDDEETGAFQSVHAYLNRIRGEMKKTDTNKFFLSKVVNNVVENYIAKGQLAEARTLMSKMENLDVTGNGGKLGKTADGEAIFATLYASLERAERTTEHPAQKLRQARELATEQAIVDVAKAAAQYEGGVLDNVTRDQVIKDYYAAHGSSPEALMQAKAFADGFTSHVENKRRANYDPAALADFTDRLNGTIDPDQLAVLKAENNRLFREGRIDIRAYENNDTDIRARSSLHQYITPTIVSAFAQGTFVNKVSNGQPIQVLNLGNAQTDADSDLWFGAPAKIDEKTKKVLQPEIPALKPQYKDAFIKELPSLFTRAMQNQLLAYKDKPDQIGPNLETIKAEATVEAKNNALQLLKTLSKKSAGDKTVAEKKVEAVTASRAALDIPSHSLWATLNGSTQEPSRAYIRELPKPKGVAKGETERRVFTPSAGDDLEQALKAQAALPKSQWDVMATPSWFESTRSSQGTAPRVLDLRELANEINAEGTENDAGKGNPGRRAVAGKYYGIAKSFLGFTTKEVQEKTTKHGVPFDAETIDSGTITVFDDLATLEKEWNKGDYTPLFEEIKNAVHDGHKLHPEKFYKTQRTLLSAKVRR